MITSLAARQRQPHAPTQRTTPRSTDPGANGEEREIEFIGAVGRTIATARQALQRLTELQTHAIPFHSVPAREYIRDVGGGTKPTTSLSRNR